MFQINISAVRHKGISEAVNSCPGIYVPLCRLWHSLWESPKEPLGLLVSALGGAVPLAPCTADPTVLPGDKELENKLVQLRGRLQGCYYANAFKCK